MKLTEILIVVVIIGILAALMLSLGCCDSTEKPAQTVSGRKETSDVYKTNNIPLDNEEGVASLSKNYYFVFDGSGSMAQGACGTNKFESKLDATTWAVDEFLKQVPNDVNLGLIVFDGRGIRETVPLGPNNRDKFSKEIHKISAGGGTPLADAINTATDKLVEQYKKQLGYGEYRIVVITDGQADRIPSAVTRTEKYGFPIYTIGICINNNHPLHKHSLSYRSASNPDDLKKALGSTLAELPEYDASEFEAITQ